MADPTPEDFERARQFADNNVKLEQVIASWAPEPPNESDEHLLNLARCHLATLARLEAAERKVAELEAANADLESRIDVADEELRELEMRVGGYSK